MCGSEPRLFLEDVHSLPLLPLQSSTSPPSKACAPSRILVPRHCLAPASFRACISHQHLLSFSVIFICFFLWFLPGWGQILPEKLFAEHFRDSQMLRSTTALLDPLRCTRTRTLQGLFPVSLKATTQISA